MHTIRTLEGSTFEEMLLPPFRKLFFTDEPDVVLVSTHLRYAWTATPPIDDAHVDSAAIGAFIKASHESTLEERATVPQNPDTDQVHTPWRDEVYHMWNHVFYDVYNFFHEVGAENLCFRPPSHAVLGVEYPTAAGDVAAERMWQESVLLLPAYLGTGVSLRVTMKVATAGGKGWEEKVIGVFDDTNTTEIWYIKSGTITTIHVDGTSTKYQKGVAAVLVYGILSTYPDLHDDMVQNDRDTNINRDQTLAVSEETTNQNSAGNEEGVGQYLETPQNPEVEREESSLKL